MKVESGIIAPFTIKDASPGDTFNYASVAYMKLRGDVLLIATPVNAVNLITGDVVAFNESHKLTPTKYKAVLENVVNLSTK